MKNHQINVTVNIADVYDEILQESSWYCAHNSTRYRLTMDNRMLIANKLKQGYDELLSHLSPWVEESSFNPNIDTSSVRLTLRVNKPRHISASAFSETLGHALASYALMRFYCNETNDIYQTAWRKHSAHLLLMLARDART